MSWRDLRPGARDPGDLRGVVYLSALLVLLVFAVRLYWVARYATSAPFWDQWDAEIDRLLVPIAQERYTWTSLFEAHNEHRIFFTRLMTMALFGLNGGQFDARVECLFNLLLYCLAVLVMSIALLRHSYGAARPVLALFFALVLALPFSWENIVGGFQSQFYFLLGFSVAAIWIASTAELRLAKVGTLFLMALCAMFSMASGLLVPMTLCALAVLRWIDGSAPRRAAIILLISQALLVVFGYLILPESMGASFHAQDPRELLSALKMVLSWPKSATWLHVALVWLPTFYLGFRVARDLIARRALLPGHRLFAGILAWVLLQAAAMAYSRGHDMVEIASRYLDILSVGICANVAIALTAAFGLQGRVRVAAVLLSAIYMSQFVIALALATPGAMASMGGRQDGGARVVRMLRAYVATGNPASLEGNPGMFAYPDSGRIARTLDMPVVAAMMPADIRRPIGIEWLRCDGFKPDGTYPRMPRMPYPDSRGSYHAPGGDSESGQCRTGPFSASTPYVSIRIAGYFDPPRLDVRETSGRGQHSLRTSSNPGETWSMVSFRAEPGMALEAVDTNPDAWIAFTAPVETGRLSALFNMIASKLIGALIFLGATLFAGLVVLSARKTPT